MPEVLRVGGRLPDFGFVRHLADPTEDGRTTTHRYLPAARAVLFNLAGDPAVPEVAARWRAQVDVVTGTPSGEALSVLGTARILLVGPDGDVGWIGEVGVDGRELAAALEERFGPPATGS